MTTATSAAPAPPSANDPGELGGRAARGFAWLGVQSVAERIASGIGQVVLVWLLAPGAFKLVGLTYTVTVFAALMQSAGLREVLQQRQRRLSVWTSPGFWLSLAFGLASAMVILAVTPWAVSFYDEPRLRPLLFVAAIALPLNAAGIVPEVVLRTRLRFGVIALAGSIVLIGQVVLSIVFAMMDMGPMSIILPQPIFALVRLAIYWWAARPRIRHGPRPGRWKFLLADSSAMLLGSLAFMLTYQGGQMVLGRALPDSNDAGLYYLCTVLADQSVRFLVYNLGGVLLPALALIQHDRARLSKAFLNASGLLLLVGMPICALQAVLAAPLLRLFFPDTMIPAIPAFAIISAAAIGRLAFGPAESMLQAQGRFRAYMVLAFVYTAVFMGGMVGAAALAPAAAALTWTAAAGAACLLMMGPCALRLAVGPSGLGWKDVAGLYRAPVLCTAASLLPVAALVAWMPRTPVCDAVTIAAGTLSCGGLYALLVRTFAPGAWNHLSHRVAAMAPARLRPLVKRVLPLRVVGAAPSQT